MSERMLIFHLSVRYFSRFAACFAIIYLHRLARHCLKVANIPPLSEVHINSNKIRNGVIETMSEKGWLARASGD